MNNKVLITKLEQAMLPQSPAFMVVVQRYINDPEAKSPAGYEGMCVIIKSFTTHEEWLAQ